MANITAETLIQFHYGELNNQDNNLVESALATDWTLNEKYNVIKTSASRLNTLQTDYNPKHAINNIMEYAQSKIRVV